MSNTGHRRHKIGITISFASSLRIVPDAIVKDLAGTDHFTAYGILIGSRPEVLKSKAYFGIMRYLAHRSNIYEGKWEMSS